MLNLNSYIVLGASLLAILFAIIKFIRIIKKDEGDILMSSISSKIYIGARTFLNRQYKVLIIFVIIVAFILYFLNKETSIAFLLGSFFSALAGNLAMRIATKSNSRTAKACEKNIGHGFRIAFSSGIVGSMFVSGLGLLGIFLLYIVFKNPETIYGFGFGASAVALFARVAGGIYTKGADVAADMVGKVEKKIPEDDPRNPAVIADQVGDNVGDVAGMSADLFESYVDAIIAAMVLGMLVSIEKAIFPLLLGAFGIIACITASFLIYTNNSKKL